MTDAPKFDDLVATPLGTATRRKTGSHANATGVQLDAWLAALLTTPRRRRLFAWTGPVAVTLLAAVLRLVNLGNPHSLVFDETYYVKDAVSMLKLGYEGQWPNDADTKFNLGIVNQFTSDGEYIAHPPLGKWIISLGMQLFGTDNPFGWRFSTAIVGVLAVALVCLIAFTLFRSTVLATIAGALMAIDGLAIVMSRTALLDNSLMLLTLLGVGAIILDRGQSERRLLQWIAQRTDATGTITGTSTVTGNTDWGPVLWNRPWLITAAALFGLASGVKWSGLYFLAGFLVYTLLVDAAARRRAGITFWASSVVFRQAAATALITLPVAALAYLSTWTGWLITRGGYNRNWAETQAKAGDGSILPSEIGRALQSLWHYQVEIYNSNIGQHTPHNYAANPLSWLALIRPTAFFYRGTTLGQNGCTISDCSEYVTSIANPVLWWLCVAAAFFLLFRMIRRLVRPRASVERSPVRSWATGLILTGIAVGYLPWLLYTGRTVFQFYTIVFLPYLILGFTLVIGRLLGSRSDNRWRRSNGVGLVAVILVAIAAVSAFFWSAWSGTPVSGFYQQLHYWLPTWA